MKPRPIGSALLLAILPLQSINATPFNYAEALQKSLYFYEAQESGRLSPNNRVEWRGIACLTDGADIGKDLSGGWFDAGDQWTANLTMSFAAMTLAWSAVEHPESYLQAGQMDELLGGLVHVNDYFARCVLNPECKDPAAELEVVIGCGGREGVDQPAVHSIWAGAEVAHLMTKRPTFRVNKSAPAGEIPAAMAAAMTASSMVIRDHGALLKSKKGYESFDPAAFADRLLTLSEKLTLFAVANAGPVITDKTPAPEQERIRKARALALRSDGKIVETGYRADPFDKIVAAASWLQRAHQAKDPAVGSRWYDLANEVYEGPYKAEWNNDWWKDYGAGNFGKIAAFNLMRLKPSDPRFHGELQYYCVRYCDNKATEGGLKFREWFSHEYGSLRHANNSATILLHYSDYVISSPVLTGNTWWKGTNTNEQLAARFRKEGQRQVDYALGDNPYGRSYMVGFGKAPFNNVHHRGAYGPWAGFDHFIPGKADDRSANRHLLYGAIVAGPDHNDVFLCGDKQKWLPVPGTKDSDVYYAFANRTAPVRKTGYVWDPGDQPYQDVMDSKFNEVALDYNAGITASFAWLLSKGLSSGKPIADDAFPPREDRNESTDLKATDREFFVAARQISAGPAGSEIEATLWIRSRWPSRVATNMSFRVYVTVDEGVEPTSLRASLTSGNAKLSEPKLLGGDKIAFQVSFPGQQLFPGSTADASRVVRLKFSAAKWGSSNDWSLRELSTEPKLITSIPVYEADQKLSGAEPPL